MSSTVIAKNIQVGTSGTATNNFTWYQPAAPDGTVRLGVGNYGATTLDVVTVANTGNVTLGGTTTLTNISYSGTLTGGTGVVNLGSGQVYKDASGNVGIGVTPSAWSTSFRRAFQVGTGAALSGVASGASDYFALTGNAYLDSGPTYRYISSTTATRYEASAAEHRWYTAASGTAGNAISFTQAMTLDSSGNLLVGTTNSNPVAGRVNGLAIANSGFTTIRAANNMALGLSGSSGGHIAFYTDNGSNFVTAGNISSNGSTTSYNATSDYRLKDNVRPLSGALARVAQLRPVQWTWKEGFGGTQPECEGFIAHELQEVVPVAVTGNKDVVDAEGNPVYQGIDTSFLVATLTAAIQEQQAIIESLTARIAALEAK